HDERQDGTDGDPSIKWSVRCRDCPRGRMGPRLADSVSGVAFLCRTHPASLAASPCSVPIRRAASTCWSRSTIAGRSWRVYCARRRSGSEALLPALRRGEGRPRPGQFANGGGVQTMPYTVTRKGGIGEYEMDAYIRQLTRWGISLGRAPRAPDPQTRRRWLPVWEDRKTAEKFVQELLKEEDYDNWRIEKVPA